MSSFVVNISDCKTIYILNMSKKYYWCIWYKYCEVCTALCRFVPNKISPLVPFLTRLVNYHTLRSWLKVTIDIPYASPPQGMKYFTIIGPYIDCMEEHFLVSRKSIRTQKVSRRVQIWRSISITISDMISGYQLRFYFQNLTYIPPNSHTEGEYQYTL
jgi:hypothetical protein